MVARRGFRSKRSSSYSSGSSGSKTVNELYAGGAASSFRSGSSQGGAVGVDVVTNDENHDWLPGGPKYCNMLREIYDTCVMRLKSRKECGSDAKRLIRNCKGSKAELDAAIAGNTHLLSYSKDELDEMPGGAKYCQMYRELHDECMMEEKSRKKCDYLAKSALRECNLKL